MGAYFPGWLLAAMLGIILAGCSKIALDRIGLRGQLLLPMLVYISLAFLWSGLCWIVFFA